MVTFSLKEAELLSGIITNKKPGMVVVSSGTSIDVNAMKDHADDERHQARKCYEMARYSYQSGDVTEASEFTREARLHEARSKDLDKEIRSIM